MAFDTVCLRAMIAELTPILEGAKIDKIQQPTQDTLIFSLRTYEGNRKLLLNTGAAGPRIQLTRASFENPAQPPMFCMFLRKYLLGARITGVSQPGGDRIVALELACTDELGDASRRVLQAELMGRYSNVMLLDSDGHIMDCLRRVDAEMSPVRQILPGLYYRLPALQDKLTLEDSTPETVAACLSAADGGMAADKYLLAHFAWLSPSICRELVWRVCGFTNITLAALDRDALALRINKLREDVQENRFKPTMLTETRRDASGREQQVCVDYSFMPMLQFGPVRQNMTGESFSGLLDDFYAAKEAAQHMQQKTQGVRKVVSSAHTKLAKKLALQRQELSTAADREAEKRLGDLIMANIWKLSKGMKTAVVQDFTDPECPEVEIKLDVRWTPQQNAQRHYKQYTRLKHAEEMLTKMIADGERELAYLESVLEELSRCETTAELAEIRTELWQNGYASQKWATGSSKKQKEKPLPPLEFTSSAGMTILVGRNNRQNEQLSLKTASRTDIWCHAQKIHGSHVILVCEGHEPDDRSLTEACALAAFYSSASASDNVPVDYCQARYVKKQPDGKTGMVIYTNYYTAYVTPAKPGNQA